MKRSDEAITTTLTAPHDLDDFPAYVLAAANLTDLRRQEDDVAARLAAAIRRMHEICQNKPIPPRDCDREVNDLHRQIETLKVAIVAAEHVLRYAEGEAALEISKAMKPAHDELRGRMIKALTELRDALDAESRFRADLDARSVLSSSVITSATVPELAEPGKLAAIIAGLEGGF